MDAEARRLWTSLGAGSVVWLSGDLGSGKTAFVQAIARAAGAADGARSPTFALLHAYDTPAGPIYHADCYRLKHPAEAVDLDLDALTRDARLVLIEWPERAGARLPPPDAHFRFSHVADSALRRMERVR
jgi:tRNA threonylcarbamoyl adenosine modification protein YjeE